MNVILLSVYRDGDYHADIRERGRTRREKTAGIVQFA